MIGPGVRREFRLEGREAQQTARDGPRWVDGLIRRDDVLPVQVDAAGTIAEQVRSNELDGDVPARQRLGEAHALVIEFGRDEHEARRRSRDAERVLAPHFARELEDRTISEPGPMRPDVDRRRSPVVPPGVLAPTYGGR